MAEPFTIEIKLKPYVRKYITDKYGDPVNLYGQGQDDLLYNILSFLKKPKHDRDKDCDLNGYLETRFIISQRDFYRNGFWMSKTDMIKVNARIENYIKKISRTYISTLKSTGIPIDIAIRTFQKDYELTEEYMSYELIKKDFLRNGKYLKDNSLSNYFKKIRKIILTEMSEFRHSI